DLENTAELALDLDSQNVRFGGHNVAQRTRGNAEPGGARKWHRPHRRAVAVVAGIDQVACRCAVAWLWQIGPAVIRRALFALVDIPERHLGGVIELCADRGRHTPTPGPDIVPIRRVGFGIERGDATRNIIALAAGVDVGAATAHRVDRCRALDEGLTGRKLRDIVDGAAGRAAAEGKRRRSFVDLDTINVEKIAGVPTGIAKPVAENIATGDEAADDRAVALLPALTGHERDAGDRAQRILHRGEAPFLDFLLRDHVDGLRRVEQRPLQPGDGLLGRPVAALVAAGDVDRRQLQP